MIEEESKDKDNEESGQSQGSGYQQGSDELEAMIMQVARELSAEFAGTTIDTDIGAPEP